MFQILQGISILFTPTSNLGRFLHGLLISLFFLFVCFYCTSSLANCTSAGLSVELTHNQCVKLTNALGALMGDVFRLAAEMESGKPPSGLDMLILEGRAIELQRALALTLFSNDPVFLKESLFFREMKTIAEYIAAGDFGDPADYQKIADTFLNPYVSGPEGYIEPYEDPSISYKCE